MALQDTPRIASMAVETSAPTKPAAKPIRRLPVQKDWPALAIVATQIGILVGIVALWEIAARAGWISGFFWSQPSAVLKTGVIFFTEGDARSRACVARCASLRISKRGEDIWIHTVTSWPGPSSAS